MSNILHFFPNCVFSSPVERITAHRAVLPLIHPSEIRISAQANCLGAILSVPGISLLDTGFHCASASAPLFSSQWAASTKVLT